MRGTGDIIKELRKRKGISQSTLAAAMGYKDRTTIAKIEANTIAPSLKKLEELARFFNVTLAYLRNSLERNLCALDYVIIDEGDAVKVEDTIRGRERRFPAEEWESLRATGSADVVARILASDKKTPSTMIDVEGLPSDKRWLVEYVMSLSDDEAKQLRGVVDFVRSQRG